MRCWLIVVTLLGCGRIGFGDAPSDGGAPDGASVDNSAVSLELLAGTVGGTGNVDGTGAAARFYSPTSVAVDRAGNVYVADQANDTIRKVTPAGEVTTFAGIAGTIGFADGVGSAAQFFSPAGVAVDNAGNVYVADTANFTIRKITPAGAVTTLAGTVGSSGSKDGTGTAAQFNQPESVAADAAGNVYVADSSNYTVRKISPAGVVTTLAGMPQTLGSTDGTGAAARFNRPVSVAADAAGNVYVADSSNCTIRKITAAGVVSTLAGTAGKFGSADGTGAAAQFTLPSGVAVDATGNVYVADLNNNTIRKVTAAGVVTTVAGAAGVVGGSTDGAGIASDVGSRDGTGAAARFNGPAGLAVDSDSNIYVADRFNATIRKLTLAGEVTTIAGVPGTYGKQDGTGAGATFLAPTDLAIDRAGDLYVSDQSNALIRKVTADGTVTTVAGSAAQLKLPAGLTIDSAGNLYVVDSSELREITAAGVATTLAGNGTLGDMDGTGMAAQFDAPEGIAIDRAGTLYVVDTNNNTVRMVTAAGSVTSFAGVNLPGYADGPGATARFYAPQGVAIDSADNLYVADPGNSIIRKITPAGVVTTIAGTPRVSGLLLGAAPHLAFPTRLAIVGDSIVISDQNAVLLLRHGAR